MTIQGGTVGDTSNLNPQLSRLNEHEVDRAEMRSLLIGASLVALMTPAAFAQQSKSSGTVAESSQTSPGTYEVFFAFNKSTLSSSAKQVIAQAAQDYKSTGSATISLTGHTDTVGSQPYNQRLSERRAQAVQAELVRDGVSPSAVTTVGDGENDLLVPTAEGVREPRNRRVQIVVPQPPAPAPVAQAPAVETPMQPTPAAAPESSGTFGLSVSPIYGHNFQETDDGAVDDLVGGELQFNALPGFLAGLTLKQDIFYSLNAVDNGVGGRSVLSFGIHPNLGFIQPTLSINAGGIYGSGVQTGFVAGPEIGLTLNLIDGFTLRPKVAYDYQFRNSGLDEGILWGGLDLGIKF